MNAILRRWPGMDDTTRHILDEVADIIPHRVGRGAMMLNASLHDGLGGLTYRDLTSIDLRRYAQALYAAADWLDKQNAPDAGEEER